MRIIRTAVLTLTATAGLLAGAPLAASAAPAAAAHHRCYDDRQISQRTGDNFGILNGNQIAVPIDLGLDLSHNALGLLGNAASHDDRGWGHRHHRHGRYCR